MRSISLPMDDDIVRSLHVGDPVSLTGVMMTGRDTVHKWMVDTFIQNNRTPQGDDQEVYEAIRPILAGSAIYHCGPVIDEPEPGRYRFVAAGPTTSTREEPYQGDVMRHFDIKAVIGKGGMGLSTLAACEEVPGVYLHAIGGAASLIAQSVRRVIEVHKLEFGVPEAMWVIEVEGFPAVVTMDAHGGSLHEEIRTNSSKVFDQLIPH
jgi:fumarate hydratase subunit beta